MLSKLTLEEKAKLCAGLDAWHTFPIDCLNIPAIMVADGPHGLRKELEDGSGEILRESYPATCFPTASALASTWNVDLVSQVGSAIADECLAAGVSVLLGPGANIKRSPLCGRNFEYFSEDPYLTGEIATAFIEGVQSKGVGTSLKHFAANNQEYRRMLIDAVVDQRALREIYLPGFESAVRKAHPWTVMAAYNKINGTYCTENEWLLQTVLRDEWGFEGFVISDWGAVNDRVKGIAAGLDLEMPGIPNGNDQLIIDAVQSGELDEHTLDAAIFRMLQFIDACQSHISTDHSCDLSVNHQMAMKAASEGAVLLKNSANLLPLDPDVKVALIGQFAKVPRYQGSGSSLIRPSRLQNLYDVMAAAAGADKINYADGYALDDDQKDDILIAEAVRIASGSDAVVVCAGLPEMDEIESRDRSHMRLPESHNCLIDAVVSANPNTVVLLSNGSPVEMPWIDRVPAVLEGYLGGQAGAAAHYALLYGEINPSGKLAETFPHALEDNPSHRQFPGGPQIVEYRESIYVGYRFYDSVKKDVLFPFGHGLSYTAFTYSDLNVSSRKIKAGDDLTVTFRISNSGKRAGKEIAQVYVRDIESTVFRPAKELKGFMKVDLAPGESELVSVSLDTRAFAFYDPQAEKWSVESGEFEILVGASSRDLRLSTVIHYQADEKITANQPMPLYDDFPSNADISQAAFERLIGRPVPKNASDAKPYTLNTSVMDMRASVIGRLLERIIRKQLKTIVTTDMHGPTRLMIEQMALESPLRLLVMFSGGALNREMLLGLIDLANGKILQGIGRLIHKGRKSAE